jgi:hypothetical protein
MPIPEMPGGNQFGLGPLEAHQVCSAPDGHGVVLTGLQVSLLVLRSRRRRVLSTRSAASKLAMHLKRTNRARTVPARVTLADFIMALADLACHDASACRQPVS